MRWRALVRPPRLIPAGKKRTSGLRSSILAHAPIAGWVTCAHHLPAALPTSSSPACRPPATPIDFIGHRNRRGRGAGRGRCWWVGKWLLKTRATATGALRLLHHDIRHVFFVAIIALGSATCTSASAQPSSDEIAFAVEQNEFQERFNQVAYVNQLKAYLTLRSCNPDNKCFYDAYGRFYVDTSAYTTANLRILFVKSTGFVDVSASLISVSAIIALIGFLAEGC
jgi:hypothetical protein